MLLYNNYIIFNAFYKYLVKRYERDILIKKKISVCFTNSRYLINYLLSVQEVSSFDPFYIVHYNINWMGQDFLDIQYMFTAHTY